MTRRLVLTPLPRERVRRYGFQGVHRRAGVQLSTGLQPTFTPIRSTRVLRRSA